MSTQNYPFNVRSCIQKGGGCCQQFAVINDQNTKTATLESKASAFNTAGAKLDNFCGICFNGTAKKVENKPDLQGFCFGICWS
jgi:hypothetical protein